MNPQKINDNAFPPKPAPPANKENFGQWKRNEINFAERTPIQKRSGGATHRTTRTPHHTTTRAPRCKIADDHDRDDHDHDHNDHDHDENDAHDAHDHGGNNHHMTLHRKTSPHTRCMGEDGAPSPRRPPTRKTSAPATTPASHTHTTPRNKTNNHATTPPIG